MTFKRAGIVVLAMTSLFVAAQFLLICITTLTRAAQILPDPWGTALAIICLLLHIAFFVLLFLGLPEFFLLLRLRALGLWTRLATGGASGFFFLLALFSDSWSAAMVQKPKSVVEGMFQDLGVRLGDPIGLVTAFFKHVDGGGLILSLLFGMAIGAFMWAPIYRLSGDNRRDWDQPMLGGRPPYSR